MHDAVAKGFSEKFGTAPQVVAYAPGRLEILGNHTDYNEGVVLSCAVNLGTLFAASPVEGSTCTIKDLRDGSQRSFEIDGISEFEKGDWANYIKGTILEMPRRGIVIPAFNATLLSNIPMSAGMSSSAALEVSTAYALGKLAVEGLRRCLCSGQPSPVCGRYHFWVLPFPCCFPYPDKNKTEGAYWKVYFRKEFTHVQLSGHQRLWCNSKMVCRGRTQTQLRSVDILGEV